MYVSANMYDMYYTCELIYIIIRSDQLWPKTGIFIII